MQHIIDGDDRKPLAGTLTYGPGVEIPTPYKVMGPTSMGEYLWPCTFEQDETRTRVGFAYVPPAQVGEAMRAVKHRKLRRKARAAAK